MSTTLILPPIAVLASAAAELVNTTTSTAEQHALNKAAMHLHEGISIMPTHGGFLIPSGSRGGIIHRIDNVNGCSCEAGRSGKVCWHTQLIKIIEQAQTRAISPVDRIAARRKALELINELF